MMAYTSSLRYADTTHAHEIEVIGAGQTRKIVLPDRPDDYSQHKGDIWKLGIIEDLGFLPGTCLRYTAVHTLCIGGVTTCTHAFDSSLFESIFFTLASRALTIAGNHTTASQYLASKVIKLKDK